MPISFSRYYWKFFVQKYASLLDWSELSRNPNISYEIFSENLYDYSWDFKRMITNPNITIEDIVRFNGISSDWKIENAILNPNITIEFITKHPEIRWNSHDYLFNPRLNLEDTLENMPTILNPLNVFFLHKEFEFKPSTLIRFPNFHWNWRNISQSRFLDLDFVMNNPELDWNLSGLSENPNIRMTHVLQRLARWNWDWVALSKNEAIDKEIILEHPDCPWKMAGLIENPNLVLADILELCKTLPSLRSWDDNYNMLLLYQMSFCVGNENTLFSDIQSSFVRWRPSCFAKKKFIMEQRLFYKRVQDTMDRTCCLKQELIQTVFHPSKLDRLLQTCATEQEAMDYWTTM